MLKQTSLFVTQSEIKEYKEHVFTDREHWTNRLDSNVITDYQQNKPSNAKLLKLESLSIYVKCRKFIDKMCIEGAHIHVSKLINIAKKSGFK